MKRREFLAGLGGAGAGRACTSVVKPEQKRVSREAVPVSGSGQKRQQPGPQLPA
jgi:hypothetical protein